MPYADEFDDPLEAVEFLSSEASSVREQRDRAIRLAFDAGHSLRTIAEEARLSHSAVAKIVKKTQL